MKVLWLTNGSPFEVKNGGGGWFTSMKEMVEQNENVTLYFCYPDSNDSITDCALTFKKSERASLSKYSTRLISRFEETLKRFKPDIIHIWGTEFIHSLCMLEAADNINMRNKVIVHIQGLCFACAEQYDLGLPFFVKHGFLPRDLVLGNVNITKKRFRARGIIEKEVLKRTNYVFGRTHWDKFLVGIINPNVHYFQCGELLRMPFYESKWCYENCEKHSIFISAANYPLKGIHFVLNALSIVKSYYPDLVVYIAGNDLLKNGSFATKIQLSMYGLYVKKEIKKLHLQENIKFLGKLNANEMCNQYLKTNLYILPSILENSSNSLGEAQMLGVPSIATYVGGNPSFIENFENGFLYSFSDSFMLAAEIKSVFDAGIDVTKIAENGRVRAKKIFDKNKIYTDLINAYDYIMNQHAKS